MTVLLKFDHGLGDCVQLTSVLLHLREAHPDWQIDLGAGVGKHTAFAGLVHRVYVRDQPPEGAYDQVFDLAWPEADRCYADCPSTKAEKCLAEVFGIAARPELCRYRIELSHDARRAAAEYLASIGCRREGARYNAVLLHYEGNTATGAKNLDHKQAGRISRAAIDAGRVPVILDWDFRSPLPSEPGIHCPDRDHPLWLGTGTGDAERLAALIEASELFLGIDSGPQKVAMATDTPSIGLWHGLHPLHYAAPAANFMHLVPEGHQGMLRGATGEALHYFARSYHFACYNRARGLVDLAVLAMQAQFKRPGPFPRVPDWPEGALRTSRYDLDYYEQHRAAGLDYAAYSDWQQSYGRWLVEALDWQGKAVLDVGCACGAQVRGLLDAGARARGVDVCEAMIQIGRQRFKEAHLACCDAVNLHLLADGELDAVHCHQVAEHWRPELVPLILRELLRVLKPGGLSFCVLDTAESAGPSEYGDPTHLCIRPMAWWHEQLEAAGWQLATDEIKGPLEAHALSFFPRYPQWAWFAARKGSP